MSAHLSGEAASVPVSMAEKAAALESELGDFIPDLEDDEEPEGEEGDEYEADDDLEGEDDDSEEPGEPAIPPPVSLNAEEKEVFAQLPRKPSRHGPRVKPAATHRSKKRPPAQVRPSE